AYVYRLAGRGRWSRGCRLRKDVAPACPRRPLTVRRYRAMMPRR
ncbi:hypothetical protein LTSEALA_3823, partial [Salmonella enterica subsp. enterica serovar Alachua str. R6-377]